MSECHCPLFCFLDCVGWTTFCVFVDFLVQFGVDGADFGVCDTVSLALRVENGMDVEARGGGFSRGETDALDEFFL